MSGQVKLGGRTVSVRLDEESFQILALHAKVEGVSMGTIVRRALSTYSDVQRADAEWTSKVEELHRQLRPLLPPVAGANV